RRGRRTRQECAAIPGFRENRSGAQVCPANSSLRKVAQQSRTSILSTLRPVATPGGGQHVNFDLGEKCERAKSFLSSSVQARMKVRSGNRASGSSRFHAACATCFQV